MVEIRLGSARVRLMRIIHLPSGARTQFTEPEIRDCRPWLLRGWSWNSRSQRSQPCCNPSNGWSMSHIYCQQPNWFVRMHWFLLKSHQSDPSMAAGFFEQAACKSIGIPWEVHLEATIVFRWNAVSVLQQMWAGQIWRSPLSVDIWAKGCVGDLPQIRFLLYSFSFSLSIFSCPC